MQRPETDFLAALGELASVQSEDGFARLRRALVATVAAGLEEQEQATNVPPAPAEEAPAP